MACSALVVRTTGTIPTSVMNARISLAVIALTLTRRAGGKLPTIHGGQFTPRRGTIRGALRHIYSVSLMSINDQLERILNTPPLVSSPSLSRFLRYVVEETIAGRSGA